MKLVMKTDDTITDVRSQSNVLNISVLPTFEVKLMHRGSFFFVDSEELSIDVRAT